MRLSRLILLIGLFASNASALEGQASRRDSAGIEIVQSPARDRPLAWRFEKLSTIRTGRKGSGPGEFNDARAIAVDPDGTVAVYDLRKHKLVRFDRDGTIIQERELGPGYTGGRVHHTGAGYFYNHAIYPNPVRGKGEVLPIDVFQKDGQYLGTLPAGAPFPAALLPDGRIAAYGMDELDVGRIVIYRVGR